MSPSDDELNDIWDTYVREITAAQEAFARAAAKAEEKRQRRIADRAATQGGSARARPPMRAPHGPGDARQGRPGRGHDCATVSARRCIMPKLTPRQEPHALDHTSPYGLLCLACGERDLFRFAVDGAIVILSVADLAVGMRLVGCGRCGVRQSIVLEDQRA